MKTLQLCRFTSIKRTIQREGIPQAVKRRYSTETTTTTGLIEKLCRNPEIDQADAINELRWIKRAIATEPQFSKIKDRGEGLLFDMVDRRAKGEPLQYILGTTDFGPLMLKCRAPTLIPRPETAHMTTLLSSKLQKYQPKRPLEILDLCSGSGCISLLMKYHLGSRARITGLDVSEKAIELSRENAVFSNLDVDVTLDNLWNLHWTAKVDFIVSNPPYIPIHEYETLDNSVKLFEDPLALIGDPESVPGAKLLPQGVRGDKKGLSFYRQIATLLPALLTSKAELKSNGWEGVPRVAVEIGFGQAQDVQNIFLDCSDGLINKTEVWKDQFGVERMVVGYQ